MSGTCRVGLTRDFLKPDGSFGFGDIGLSMLDQVPNVAWDILPRNSDELTPDDVADYDALLVLGPRVTSRTLASSERLSVVARFGVGYDNVDVAACTERGVMLTITPEGVRRPVAMSVITFLLALSHKLVIKDRLTRSGRWAEKLDHIGQGVTGRTLGIIGLGNIGQEVVRLAQPLGMKFLAYDPHVAANGNGAAVQMTSLDNLLRQSDFVCVCCALTAETRHLLDARTLALMKRTAYLINVARGPIIDQAALTVALRERQIQGAALDVFEVEPIPPDDPLLALDNVILAPHAICWTDEGFLLNGRSACQSILDIASGRIPAHVVNRGVVDSPLFQSKLARLTRHVQA